MKKRITLLMLTFFCLSLPVLAEKQKKDVAETTVTVDQMYMSVSTDLYMPLLYKKADFVIDGNLSEWTGASFIHIPANNAQVDYVGYNGEDDLSAKVYFSYDEEYLYVGAEVTDDKVIFTYGSDAYWRGDSFQIAFGQGITYGPEYGFGYDTNKAPAVFGSHDVAQKFSESVEFVEVSEKNHIFYEVKIPWEATPFGSVAEAMQTCVVINDNDSGGRDGWLEWKAGIGRNKNPSGFAKMLPVSKDQTLFTWLDGSGSVEHATEQSYRYYAANFSNESKEVSIDIDGKTSKITIPANSVYSNAFSIVFTEPGDYEISYALNDDKKSFPVNVVKAAVPAELYARADALEARMPAWRAEIDALYSSGIGKDYMDVDYYVIDKFIPYVREDIARSVSENYKRLAQRAMTQLDRLEEIADGLDKKIAGFKQGTEKSLPVPLYRTSKIEKEGYHYVADTENSVTGEKERRPVFFVGMGHVNQMREEFAEFQRYGFNILQGSVNITANNKMFFANWGVSGASAKVEFEPYTENPYSGKASLKLTNFTPYKANHYARIAQSTPCEPNTNYTWSFKIKGEDVASGVQMVMNPSWVTRKHFGVKGSFDWKEITYSYTTEPTQTSLPNMIILDSTGTIYLDDALLYRTDDPEKKNLFVNPGFEKYTISDNIYSLPREEELKESITNRFQPYLDNNLAVSVLYNSHYSDIITALKPETALDAVLGFVKIDLYDELAREIEYKGAGQNAKAMYGMDGVMNFMTANEPQYSTRINKRHLPQFHEFLREKYNSNIEKLNSVYKSKYNTFADIPFPTEDSGTPLFYDWMEFNDELYNEWHNGMAKEIKENNPDIWVNAKVMGDNPNAGVDIERYANTWYDINGCDSANYYTVGSRVSGILKKLSYYDEMTSFLEAPVSNAEDHILKDREQSYDVRFAPHLDADLWQGAVHSRGSSIIWVWQRTTSDTDDTAESILYRPDCLRKAGYVALDLARLSKEMTAFTEEKSEIAILFSRESRAYDEGKYYNTKTAVYEALNYTGKRVSYISDTQLVNGEGADKKVIVIPNAIHVNEDVVPALRRFIENGGKVVIYGGESLSKNVLGKKISNADRDFIFTNSTIFDVSFDAKGAVINTPQDMRDQLWTILDGCGLIDIWLRDKATGKPVYYNEWRAVEYEGKTLVNLCNYDWHNEPEIEIMRGDKVLTVTEELRESKDMNAVSLKPASYVPRLYVVTE